MGNRIDVEKTDEATSKSSFHYGTVLTVSFAHLSHDLYSSFLAPILPLLISKFGIPLSGASLLDVVRKLPSIFNPLIGLLADKVSVKWFIIIAPTLTALTMSLLGVAPGYPIILLLLLVAGISNSMFHVPSPVIIKEVAGREIGKGMSYYMLGGELARSLGPLLITTAVSIWGLEGSWRVMPIGFVASIILYFRLRNIKASHIGKKQEKASGTMKKFYKFFFLIGGLAFFRGLMHISLTLFLPTYLTQNGASLWLSGVAISILQLAGAVGTFFAGSLSDKYGRERILLITSILNPILMFIFIISNTVAKLPVLILIGFSLFATGPILLAMVQSTKNDRPSLMNGVYMALNFGISSLVSILIGVSGDMIGLDRTYAITIFAAFLTIPFIFGLKSHIKKI